MRAHVIDLHLGALSGDEPEHVHRDLTEVADAMAGLVDLAGQNAHLLARFHVGFAEDAHRDTLMQGVRARLGRK